MPDSLDRQLVGESGSAISCCGNAPMPSWSSSTGYGRTSPGMISKNAIREYHGPTGVWRRALRPAGARGQTLRKRFCPRVLLPLALGRSGWVVVLG